MGNKSSSYHHQLGNEGGFVELTTAAISLPLLILLAAAIVDLARYPLAKHHIQAALTQAPAEYLAGTIVPGNNFCDLTPDSTGAGCTATFDSQLTSGVDDAVCTLIADYLKKGYGLFKYTDFGIEVRIVKVPATTSTALASISVSSDTCGGNANSFASYSPGMSTTSLEASFHTKLVASGQAAGDVTLIGWPLYGVTSASDSALSSYWMITVVRMKLSSYFGTTLRGASASYITEYSIRPLSRPAGIER